jgi:hypothetical protein
MYCPVSGTRSFLCRCLPHTASTLCCVIGGPHKVLLQAEVGTVNTLAAGPCQYLAGSCSPQQYCKKGPHSTSLLASPNPQHDLPQHYQKHHGVDHQCTHMSQCPHLDYDWPPARRAVSSKATSTRVVHTRCPNTTLNATWQLLPPLQLLAPSNMSMLAATLPCQGIISDDVGYAKRVQTFHSVKGNKTEACTMWV